MVKRTFTHSLSLSFLLISLLSARVYAQKEPKWGKLSKEEKTLQVVPFDSSANAVILSEYGNLHFQGSYALMEVHRRIKILKKGGLEQADIRIPYYNGDNIEDIQKIKAQTINFIKGKEEKHKVSDIFDVNLSENWSVKKFSFPAVKVGSILEYSYTYSTTRLVVLDGWEFQHTLPTLYSSLKADIPVSLTYSFVSRGSDFVAKYGNAPNKDNKWVLENIPGYQNEDHVFCPKNYIDKIQFQLMSYKTANGAYHQTEDKQVLRSWDKFTKKINEEYKYYLNRNHKVEEILSSLPQNPSAEDIFNYVQQHFAWDQKTSLFPMQSMKDLLSSKQGHDSELNLLLCLLLNEAGIEANPVLISSRSHGIVTKIYPLLDQFNHVIIRAKTSAGYQLLDVIDPTLPYPLLPLEDLNGEGLLIHDGKEKWVKLDQGVTTSSNTYIKGEITADSLFFTTTKSYSGYDLPSTHIQKDDLNKIKLGDQVVLPTTMAKIGKEKNLHQKITWTTASPNDLNSGPILLDLKDFFSNNNPFPEEKRTFPVDLDYKESRTIYLTLKLSDDYKVSATPESKAFALPNKVGDFIYSVKQQGHQLTISIRFRVLQSSLPKPYYYYLKSFYNEIIKQVSTPVIIEKI